MFDARDPQPDDAPPVENEFIICWRCEKQVDRAVGQCPYCAAPVSAVDSSTVEAAHGPSDATPLLRMLLVCGLMLGVSLVIGLAVQPERIFITEAELPTAEQLLTAIIVLEAIDTALVLFALVWVAIPYRPPRPTPAQRASAWCFFWPVLAGLLAINLGYHWLLTNALQLPTLEESLARHRDLLPVWILVICIQPAIVEELFFRRVALGVLRSHLGVHGAVWISSLMFALAHIGVPLSMPMLLILGVGLGYARVVSGGLLLPMAMHFVHNAVVIGMEFYA